MKTAKKILAILEGPHSDKVAGARHVMVITSAEKYPSIVFSYDGGRSGAAAVGARHYAAGTWEAPGPAQGFPLPRPEILTEIFAGEKQQEMAL